MEAWTQTQTAASCGCSHRRSNPSGSATTRPQDDDVSHPHPHITIPSDALLPPHHLSRSCFSTSPSSSPTPLPPDSATSLADDSPSSQRQQQQQQQRPSPSPRDEAGTENGLDDSAVHGRGMVPEVHCYTASGGVGERLPGRSVPPPPPPRPHLQEERRPWKGTGIWVGPRGTGVAAPSQPPPHASSSSWLAFNAGEFFSSRLIPPLHHLHRHFQPPVPGSPSEPWHAHAAVTMKRRKQDNSTVSSSTVTSQRLVLGARSHTDLGGLMALTHDPHGQDRGRWWGSTIDGGGGGGGGGSRQTPRKAAAAARAALSSGPPGERGGGGRGGGGGAGREGESPPFYLGRPCDACSHRLCQLWHENEMSKSYQKNWKYMKGMYTMDLNKFQAVGDKDRTPATVRKVSGPGKSLPRLAAMQQMLVDPEYLKKTQEAEMDVWERAYHHQHLQQQQQMRRAAGGPRLASPDRQGGTAGSLSVRGRPASVRQRAREWRAGGGGGGRAETPSAMIQRPDMLQHVRHGQELLQSRMQQDSALLDGKKLLADILDYEIPGVKGSQTYTGLLSQRDAVDTSDASSNG
ncbi:uncharacterized protein LOC143288782 [Babylonia areolata]|uniref:uncharacterized protein LOC143288782 n=1 Tax=Babylonia areolata TaxID=304850 RepID=UPI003FCF7F10